MAVMIRLQRTGKRNAPCYRIGVFDGRTRRQGRAIEFLGYYDPRNKDESKQLSIDSERAVHWLSEGAQPSETINSLFKSREIKFESGSTRKQRKRTKSKEARKRHDAKNLKDPAFLKRVTTRKSFVKQAAPVAKAKPKKEEAPAENTEAKPEENSGT